MDAIMSRFITRSCRKSLKGTPKNPDFIPTTVLWKKFSYGQPEGYPALKLRFLAYILIHVRRSEIFSKPCIWANAEFSRGALNKVKGQLRIPRRKGCSDDEKNFPLVPRLPLA